METGLEIVATGNSLNSCARRYPRAVYSVPILVRILLPDGIRMTRGITLDVSEGGLGALMQSKLKVGGVIEIELSLPKQELTATAVVRHSSTTRCGFEFLDLKPEEHQQLSELVAAPSAKLPGAFIAPA